MTQEAMSVPNEMEAIKRIIGDWDAAVTITLPDGTRVEGTGTWTAREISMGKGIHTLMKLNAGGRAMEENDLWGYDRGGRKVHLLSITSDGTVHDHSGNLRDDNILFLRWEGIVDGRPASEEITIEWLSASEIKVLSIDYLEEKAQTKFAITMKRQ